MATTIPITLEDLRARTDRELAVLTDREIDLSLSALDAGSAAGAEMHYARARMLMLAMGVNHSKLEARLRSLRVALDEPETLAS